MSETAPTAAGAHPPEGGRRARQRADTRERLFEAALAEFRSAGFAAAQIDRIAKAAGVVRGTFYFHFPTKDDVLVELQRRIEARIVERALDLRDSALPLAQVLSEVNEIILDTHGEVGQLGLLREMLSLHLRRPDATTRDGEERSRVSSEMARHFARGQERGELRRDLEPEQMAVLCFTSLIGFYTRQEPSEELRTACRALIEVLVKGLRA